MDWLLAPPPLGPLPTARARRWGWAVKQFTWGCAAVPAMSSLGWKRKPVWIGPPHLEPQEGLWVGWDSILGCPCPTELWLGSPARPVPPEFCHSLPSESISPGYPRVGLRLALLPWSVMSPWEFVALSTASLGTFYFKPQVTSRIALLCMCIG